MVSLRVMHNRSMTPSPGEYNLAGPHSSSSASFKGSYNPDKQYLSNYARYLKGKNTPGPANYNVRGSIKGKYGYVSKIGREAFEGKT